MKTEEQIAGELAPSSLQALCPAGVIVTRVSLTFTDAATEEAERIVDGLLAEVGESQLYLVGDYVNYLARTKGEDVARARIESSYSPETVRVATWVCRKVATERRLISPSFGHSQIVAGLDPTEQELWLTRARDEGWKVRDLRAELRQRAAISKGAPDQSPADPAAARAWQAWEVFRAWYQANSPSFSPDQKEEADAALLPLITDCVAHMADEDFERLYQTRLTYLKS